MQLSHIILLLKRPKSFIKNVFEKQFPNMWLMFCDLILSLKIFKNFNEIKTKKSGFHVFPKYK